MGAKEKLKIVGDAADKGKDLLSWMKRSGTKVGGDVKPKTETPSFEQLALDLGPKYVPTTSIEEAAQAAARNYGGWAGTGGKIKSTAKFFGGSPARAATTGLAAYLFGPTVGALAGAGGGFVDDLRQIPANLISGGAGDAAGEYDYTTGIWDPLAEYNNAVTAQQQALLGTVPSEQSLADNLKRFGSMMGGGGGGGAAAGGNVYRTQAKAGLNEAAAGTGTSTSGLTPVAGTVAAQADSLLAQGASLDDYLAFMNRAADAAGVSRNSAARAQLTSMATNAYIQKQTAVQAKVAELENAKAANALKFNMIPPFVVDEGVRKQAEALQKQGGNTRPINDYINNLKKLHYWNYMNQGK